MTPNLKRLIYFFCFFTFIIGIFLSRRLIFSSKISFIGEPPYQIDRLGSQTQFCNQNPCEIRFPLGESIFVIQKKNHRPIILPLTIRFFDSQKHSLNFEELAQLTRVETYSIDQFKTSIKENSSGQYLLDSKGEILANFPYSFKPIKTISNKNYTLIISPDAAYMVDHTAKSRIKINRNFKEIPNSAQLSLNGQFVAYGTNKGLRIIGLMSPFHSFDINYPNLDLKEGSFTWLNNEKLIFATNNEFQTYESEENGLNSIYFRPDKKSNYLFATYDPKTKNFDLINNFLEIAEQPSSLSHSYLENSLYFQSGNNKFRLDL